MKPAYLRESESKLLYDWRFTADQFFLTPSHLRLTTSIFFPQLNTCGHSPLVTPSLTRRWVCRLQLLLTLARAVILSSESRGTHDYNLLSQIRDSLNLEGQIYVYIPREQDDPAIPQGSGFLHMYVNMFSVNVFSVNVFSMRFSQHKESRLATGRCLATIAKGGTYTQTPMESHKPPNKNYRGIFR
jgi:hypothetical protein